ncbi:Coatomer subunit zeta [Meyerozyma sp. JA9]|nr:Coatomer subunit zeta [Meyerozyma sp. JA9]
MSSNISLYTITACLLLDNEGRRLFAKYYQTQNPSHAYKSAGQQHQFEQSVFSKINKMHQDILLYDNHLIAYKQTNDVVLVVVSSVAENEAMVYSLANNLHEALTILLNSSLDKATVVDKYDMVSLCVDETIDDGIILEMDPAIIVSRVTNPPSASAVAGELSSKIEFSERGLMNAFAFASKKLSERIQQGI